MSDFGAPVAAGVNVNPAGGLKTISDLMGLQQQQQGIQSNAQKIQLQGIDVQKAQQANEERLNLQNFTQDPSNWQTNGQIDMGKINAMVPKIAPYTGNDYINKMSTLSTAQTQAAGAKQNLTQAQRAIVAGPIGVLGRAGVTDPKAYIQELDKVQETNPDNPALAQMVNAYKTILGTATPTPHIAEGAVKLSQSLMTPEQQQAQLSPSATTVGLGGQVSPAIVTPAVGGNAPSVQIGNLAPNQPAATTLSPAERHTVGFNASGQPFDIAKNPQGQPTGISGLPVTNAPGATQPFVMPTNENADTLKIAQSIRADANQAAAGLSTTQAFANNAIQYASGAVTGTGAQFINDLKGQYAGTPWTAPGVTDSNLMGHALSQLTGSLVKATGLSTNQGQSLVANQVADGKWTKTAIQTAAREVRALSTGASLYSQGMENRIAQVAKTDPSASQFAARTFQNQWAKVADVNAFKLYDSLKNRQTDPGALTNPDGTGILDKLGGPTAKNPKGSVLYQQTLKHIDAMRSLLIGQ